MPNKPSSQMSKTSINACGQRHHVTNHNLLAEGDAKRATGDIRRVILPVFTPNTVNIRTIVFLSDQTQ